MAKSPKTLALGAALRAAREDRNIKLREFAAHLGIDFGMLSRWETGLRTPRPENVAQILATLGVRGDEYKGIMTLARDTSTDHWTAISPLEVGQSATAFRRTEQNSGLITSVCPLLIPGLLQTADFVRALMSEAGFAPAEVEERVAKRISRREVILRAVPAHLTVVLGEAALRQQIGGPHVHLGQLRYLVEMGRRANVEIFLVPFQAGWSPLLDGAFHMFSGATVAPTVFIESRDTQIWLYTQDQVNRHRQAVRDAMKLALSPADSMRFIAGLAHRMEQRIDHLEEGDA